MADNSKSRRKALIISLLAFLFVGGGVSLFFIIQGSDDLTGAAAKNNFAYGFSVRESVLPLFKRLGISTYEDELVDATKKRLEARGIDLSPETSAPADVSDWMADRGAGASPASGSSARPGARPGATTIPKMAGRGGSMAGGSGGGTKSSGGVARFGEGSTSGNATISAKAPAGAGRPAGGTLGVLRNARALLSEGLRSGSAMIASSKWGQSFGVGSGGGKSGNMAYVNPALIKLDKIKSGEISSLKIDDEGSLKTPPVPTPARDETDAARDLLSRQAMEDKMRLDLARATAEAAAKAAAEAAARAFTGNPNERNVRPAADPNTPPDDITELGNNSKPPDGKYCPSSCSLGGGESYSDGKPDYKKEGDIWTVTYSGKQTRADGTVIPYSDKMAIIPGGTPPLQPLESYSNGRQIPFGGV